MTVRERIEREEATRFSAYAALAANSRGRDLHEEADEFRTCYQRDRDRIIHCKAFRRLKHKTQVFYSLKATTIGRASHTRWKCHR